MHHKLFAPVLHLIVMAGVIAGACALLPGNLAQNLAVLAIEHLLGLAWLRESGMPGCGRHGGPAGAAGKGSRFSVRRATCAARGSVGCWAASPSRGTGLDMPRLRGGDGGE